MIRIKANAILILAIFVITALSYSCSKSPKCWGKSKNKGIIESNIIIKCDPISREDNFAIQNDSAYYYTFNDSITGMISCSDLPDIDFGSHSLLGLWATGACEVKYIREVTSIDNESKYHYKVTVKSCGTCKKEVYSFNWVTVPKIPEGWEVTFEL